MRRQILLGRGLIGSGLGQPRYRWIAPTWTVDQNGRAYNTPDLSANLLSNSGFDSDTVWAKGAGWSIGGGVATGATASSNLVQNGVTDNSAINEAYVVQCTVVTLTAGGVRPCIGGAFGAEWRAAGTYKASTIEGPDTLGGVTGVSFSGTLDNIILQRVLNNTGFAYIRAGKTTQVGVRRYENDGFNNIQLRSNVDNPAAPQNYVSILQAGNQTFPCRFALVKVVAGVTTTLIANQNATFVADALLEIRQAGTTFSMWYNGNQLGTNQTITDAAILAGQFCGVGAHVSTVQLSEFQINGAKVPFRF